MRLMTAVISRKMEEPATVSPLLLTAMFNTRTLRLRSIYQYENSYICIFNNGHECQGQTSHVDIYRSNTVDNVYCKLLLVWSVRRGLQAPPGSR